MGLEEELTFKQELKKSFFSSEEKSANIKKVNYKQFKTTNNILTNIADQREFSEVRKRYKVHTFLEKILIKKIMNYILFAFYRKEKLSIAVLHPVAQTELNYQKKMIMDYAKMLPEFKDIKEISVFRYDKLYSFSKNYDKKAHDDFHSPFKKEQKDEIEPFFNERSYGIFENQIKDEKLHEQVERIRKLIKNS